MPFMTEEFEGFDVNSNYDWNLAEHLVKTDQAKLTSIPQSPYKIQE